jgi:hypothetical protein
MLVGQAQSALAEAFNESAVEEDDFNLLIDPSLRPAIQQLQAAADAMTQSAHEMHEAAGPDLQTDNSATDNPAEIPTQAKLTIHVDPQPQPPTPIKTEPHPIPLATSSSQISANSLVSPPDSLRNDHDDHDTFFATSTSIPSGIDMNKSVEMTNGEANSSTSSSNDSSSNPLQTPKSAASRHSSRQPKPVDRYIPDAVENNVKHIPVSAEHKAIKKEARRASSSGASITTTSNSNGGAEGRKSRRASSHTTSSSTAASTSAPSTGFLAGVVQQRRQQRAGLSSLPVVEAAGGGGGGNPDFVGGAQGMEQQGGRMQIEDEAEADEESLRLIRAIQEEEFGLRRRRGLRA